nr:immunoglobulin heavy chain junction region [Mus musculus]
CARGAYWYFDVW